MRELSVSEQRYQAVLAVISDGETVSGVAARFGVHRKTVHGWLARDESDGLEGLADRSHWPRSCPHQTGAEVEALVATMRSSHPGWGPRRLVHELGRAGVDPVPSESAVYQCLVRLNLIDSPLKSGEDAWSSDFCIWTGATLQRFAASASSSNSILARASLGQRTVRSPLGQAHLPSGGLQSADHH